MTDRKIGKAMISAMKTWPRYSRAAGRITEAVVAQGIDKLDNPQQIKAWTEVTLATGAALSKRVYMLKGAIIGVGSMIAVDKIKKRVKKNEIERMES